MTTNYPRWLSPYQEDIEATRRPYIGGKVLDSEPDGPQGSRLGGFPWWPAQMGYPLDKGGSPLLLLIQINFFEFPLLEGFPEWGLLQIFLGRDDLYGCDLDRRGGHDDFACIFHPKPVGPSLDDFSFIKASEKDRDLTPLEDPMQPFAISWKEDTMTLPPSDFRFEIELPDIAEDHHLQKYYEDYVDAMPIRLGGYPNFVQTDPRNERNVSDFGETNLLTIDSTDHIRWGDNGVAQFFIREPDLEKRDFSNVSYNWDCCQP